MSLESTVGIAKVGTKSLRATIPEGIVAYLGVEVGDKLQWVMEMQNDERIATVRKRRRETLEDALSKLAKEKGKKKAEQQGGRIK